MDRILNTTKMFIMFGIPIIMILFISIFVVNYRKTGRQIVWLQHLWEEIVIVGSIACCGFCVSAGFVIDNYFPQYTNAMPRRILSLVAFILLLVFCVSTSYSTISATVHKTVPPKFEKSVKGAAITMPIATVFLLIYVFLMP